MASSDTILEQLENYNTIDIINRAIAFVIIIAGALCLVYVFIGAISFVTASGQEDKVKQAIGTIRHAILGLILTIVSVFIVGTVGKAIFNLNVIQYISYQQIFEIITSIVGTDSGQNIDSLE